MAISSTHTRLEVWGLPTLSLSDTKSKSVNIFHMRLISQQQDCFELAAYQHKMIAQYIEDEVYSFCATSSSTKQNCNQSVYTELFSEDITNFKLLQCWQLEVCWFEGHDEQLVTTYYVVPLSKARHPKVLQRDCKEVKVRLVSMIQLALVDADSKL